MSERYKRNTGCIFNIKYHLVWCSKYRRPVLTGRIPDRLRELLNTKAQDLNIEIEVMEIQPEYVHVLITGQPTEAIQHIVNQLKGNSSRILRSEFTELRSKLPCLWSRRYYAGTIGHISEYKVQRYIESQKGK